MLDAPNISDLAWRGTTLSTSQLKTTEFIANIIIPDTDTPGATAAGVHRFIDHMVGHYMTREEAEEFTTGLDTLNKLPDAFNRLNEQKQTTIVAELDKNLQKNTFYKSFKELTIIGYYSSEIGATQELRYDPLPGPYKEIPFTEIGRAWST